MICDLTTSSLLSLSKGEQDCLLKRNVPLCRDGWGRVVIGEGTEIELDSINDIAELCKEMKRDIVLRVSGRRPAIEIASGRN